MLETMKKRMHKSPHIIIIYLHGMAVGIQSFPNMEFDA